MTDNEKTAFMIELFTKLDEVHDHKDGVDLCLLRKGQLLFLKLADTTKATGFPNFQLQIFFSGSELTVSLKESGFQASEPVRKKFPPEKTPSVISCFKAVRDILSQQRRRAMAFRIH